MSDEFNIPASKSSKTFMTNVDIANANINKKASFKVELDKIDKKIMDNLNTEKIKESKPIENITRKKTNVVVEKKLEPINFNYDDNTNYKKIVSNYFFSAKNFIR
jgi:hypothetical protein